MIATENASNGQPRQGTAQRLRGRQAHANVRQPFAPSLVTLTSPPLSPTLTLATLTLAKFSPPRRNPPLVGRSGNLRRTVATLLAVSLCAQLATAGFPESYERWERTYGVGWGDGYHAAAPSGPRPFADRPPKFPRPPERHEQRLGCPECFTRPPVGDTYYDRFDAYAEAPEGSPADVGSSVLVGRPNGSSDTGRKTRDSSIDATLNASNTPDPMASDRHRASSRHPVRPGLTNARLPSVLQPATGRQADSPRHAEPADRGPGESSQRESGQRESGQRESGQRESGLGTPRVALTPESLIIRQPR